MAVTGEGNLNDLTSVCNRIHCGLYIDLRHRDRWRNNRLEYKATNGRQILVERLYLIELGRLEVPTERIQRGPSGTLPPLYKLEGGGSLELLYYKQYYNSRANLKSLDPHLELEKVETSRGGALAPAKIRTN